MRWTSLVLALSLLPTALTQQIFYARSVSYCSSSRAIQVEKFLLEYNNDDKSISFDISAASVEPNLQASINFQLDAYGIDAVNTTINLCDTLAGVLCPLPQYDFVASATLPLPGAVKNSINVPGIGYKIPDLQATAYVRLLRVVDGTEAACLKVDLSNGKSVRFRGISWALGGLALGSLLIGFLRGLVGLLHGIPTAQLERGRSKERLVDIISFLQFVATTGLLSLNYPLIYTSFTANFAWAIGLIYIRPFQLNINDLRQRTGGNLTQLAGRLNIVGGTEAVTLSNFARLSSHVALPPSSSTTNFSSYSSETTSTLLSSLATHASNATTSLIKRAPLAVQETTIPEVQQNDTINAVQTGIPRFLVNVQISPFNGFMTVFLNFLLLLVLFLVVVLVFAIPFLVLRRTIGKKTFSGQRDRHGDGVFFGLIRANALRMLIISWFPLLLFTFFQWTLGRSDSWAPIVLSVFTFLFTTFSILFLSLRTILHVRRHSHSHDDPSSSSPSSPWSSLEIYGAAYAPLWNAYKESRWWFFLPQMFSIFARAMFVAFAQNHGWVQSVGLTAIEFIVFVSMCIFTPFSDKSSNGSHITIQILRCIISGALIVFNRSIGLNEIIRVAVGAVLAVISSVVVIGIFILVIIDFVSLLILLFRGSRQRSSDCRNSSGDMEQLDAPPRVFGMYGKRRNRSPDSVTLRDDQTAGQEVNVAGVGSGVPKDPERRVE